jgi:hypothetical protein
MADVASKQQTAALVLSTAVTRTELTDLMGNLCCAREHSVQFYVNFISECMVGFNFPECCLQEPCASRYR